MSLYFFFDKYLEYQNDDFYAFIGDMQPFPTLNIVDQAIEEEFYDCTNEEEEIDIKPGFNYIIKFLDYFGKE